MLLNGSGHFFDRRQATADCSGIPLFPAFLLTGATAIVLELNAQRFDCPDSCGLQDAGSQPLERTLP